MDFVSYYIEIAVMVGMFGVWKVVKRTKFVRLEEMDLVTDRYDHDHNLSAELDERDGDGVVTSRVGRILRVEHGQSEKGVLGKLKRVGMWFFL